MRELVPSEHSDADELAAMVDEALERQQKR
jgi:hypothetical protein